MSISPIADLFDGIAPRYDFLNHLLSFGIDRRWRRKAARVVLRHHPHEVLDVATGTADLAIKMASDCPSLSVTGTDISTEMLNIGRKKVDKKKLAHRIRLMTGDAAALPFADGFFDAVTVSFGLRNFDDREAGLREMSRVCREGGLVAVMEFSHPRNALVRIPYRWYSRWWIPLIGRHVSKHPSAYSYLPASVADFPESDVVVAMMDRAGLQQIQVEPLSGGIVTLYHGIVAKRTSKSQ